MSSLETLSQRSSATLEQEIDWTPGIACPTCWMILPATGECPTCEA